MIAFANIPPVRDARVPIQVHGLAKVSRPRDDAGCPRCERLGDTVSGCAASSRAVPPACEPSPPWLPLWVFDGSGAGIVWQTADRGGRRIVPPLPAGCA